MSAFASFASSILFSSQTTATLMDFPVPPGKLTTVLRLISFFFCLLFILKFKSIDSSNLVVQFDFIELNKFSMFAEGNSLVFSGKF